MDWAQRGRANLAAAEHCLEYEHYLAAVNRYYYSVYHVSLRILEDRGPAAPEEREGHPYWPHSTIAGALADIAEDDFVGGDIRFLLEHRIRADYRLETVTPEVARQVQQVANNLFRRLEQL